MFTGLVEDLGTVAAVDRTGDGARLTITTPLTAQLAAGDSIAVNGVCLTAETVDGATFGTFAIHETLRQSSLRDVHEGARVNLELAVTPQTRLGGHIVQGHVDGVGTVTAIGAEGDSRVITIEAEPALLRYVVHKGSITVDGVSLTVSAIEADRFEVSLIPETLTRTTLGSVQPADTVNLEVDIVAKYVEKLVTTG